MTILKVLREEELKDRVCVVVGTRPGIVKMSPVIRELGRQELPFFILHTGQHYSYDMDRVFFDELELPEPLFKLDDVRHETFHGSQTARMLQGAEAALLKEKPKLVLVGGDANTNLAGALAARKLRIYVGHIEAGLRSGDWRMPEEHNRVMIDHISDLLFAPTEEAAQNLRNDNVRGKIYLTGNTIVDAVRQNLSMAQRKSRALEQLSVKAKDYFLLTLHREENVDFEENLRSILEGIGSLGEHFAYPVIFPAHPRTVKRLEYFGLTPLPTNLRLVPPLGYLDFLVLLSQCRLVLTDSGGIQEEGCILGVPCVTLRESTERPETVSVGSNFIAGVDPARVVEGVRTMLNRDSRWANPFGEDASRKIVDVAADFLKA